MCEKIKTQPNWDFIKKLGDKSVGSGAFWVIISHTQREYSAEAHIKMQNGFVQIAK